MIDKSGRRDWSALKPPKSNKLANISIVAGAVTVPLFYVNAALQELVFHTFDGGEVTGWAALSLACGLVAIFGNIVGFVIGIVGSFVGKSCKRAIVGIGLCSLLWIITPVLGGLGLIER